MNAACIVPDAKVRDYLLNADHPDGAPKAKFFASQGFEKAKPEVLLASLYDHFVRFGPGRAEPRPPWGTRFVVIGPLRTPSGKSPDVLTVWFSSDVHPIPTFVTAYPA